MSRIGLLYYVLVLCSTVGIGCSAPSSAAGQKYLSDQYLPSAAAPSDATTRSGLTTAVEREGALRRQLVTAPSGRAYWLSWRKRTESRGSCNSGRLVHGLRLPRRGRGYTHFGESSFGTDETIAYLRFAAWSVLEQFPNTVPVLIGDLSDEGGGYLKPHRSHQSGRDVDIGLYRTQNRLLTRFKSLSPDELDLDKTWTLIEALLRTGAVKYIFLDRSIQQSLYAHAAQRGFRLDELDRLFQSSGRSRRPVIRHERGHRNHLHVRFECPVDDDECRE